jgi:hypothetical protein
MHVDIVGGALPIQHRACGCASLKEVAENRDPLLNFTSKVYDLNSGNARY